MSQAQAIKAISGDSTHQRLAIYYYKKGVSPADAIKVFTQSNYQAIVGGVLYKIQATSIASIMTGIAIASPAKSKKLSPIDNGTDKPVPSIPEI